MAEFASKGVAGSGLGLGIAGTALGLLNNGLGGLFNGTNCCNGINAFTNGYGVNHYELSQENRIATLESQVALRDANIYNDQKLLEVYKYFDGKLEAIRDTICANEKAQAVINAKMESCVDVLGSQVRSISNTLASITRTVIPNRVICPGWGEVQTTIVPATTDTGTAG